MSCRSSTDDKSIIFVDVNQVFFFFSSRRRHTRYWRDWSSDVCSSDLAGVRHVAYTSYLNPVEENPAVITPDHRDTEETLRESGLAWTMLRNAFYAEYQVPPAVQAIATGRLFHNNGEGKTAYVSREDCAAAAAAVLTTEGHEGRAYDVTGPEPLGQGDVAALLGGLSSRAVEAVAVDDEVF